MADGAETLPEIPLNSLVAGAAMQGNTDAALAAELTALSVSTQGSRANAAQRSARATSTIPLRPEIVQFMSPQSLCRLTCCSATLRRDVCEADAWQRLAEVHAPRAVRAALESDAVSRVRSCVRRRVLADALCQETRQSLGDVRVLKVLLSADNKGAACIFRVTCTRCRLGRS